MPCYTPPMTRSEHVNNLRDIFLRLPVKINYYNVEMLLNLHSYYDEKNSSYDPWPVRILCHLCENIEKMNYNNKFFTPKLKKWYSLHKLVDEGFNGRFENDNLFKYKVISACQDYLNVIEDEL